MAASGEASSTGAVAAVRARATASRSTGGGGSALPPRPPPPAAAISAVAAAGQLGGLPGEGSTISASAPPVQVRGFSHVQAHRFHPVVVCAMQVCLLAASSLQGCAGTCPGLFLTLSQQSYLTPCISLARMFCRACMSAELLNTFHLMHSCRTQLLVVVPALSVCSALLASARLHMGRYCLPFPLPTFTYCAVQGSERLHLLVAEQEAAPAEPSAAAAPLGGRRARLGSGEVPGVEEASVGKVSRLQGLLQGCVQCVLQATVPSYVSGCALQSAAVLPPVSPLA
jgi:hypothetical protein